MRVADYNLNWLPTGRMLALMAFASAWPLVVGCSKQATEIGAEAVAADSTPPLTPASLAPGQASPLDATASSKPATAPTPTTPDAEKSSAAGAYQPPFPERVDLFVAPKRQGGPASDGPQQNSVELIGFVRVDRQRAVLSIDGNVAPMAAGETQFGVEVISINPPQVVLQRGRQRWQTTLE
jgi:hypothetical protein